MVAQGALALSLGFLLLAGTVAGKQNAVDPFERVNVPDWTLARDAGGGIACGMSDRPNGITGCP